MQHLICLFMLTLSLSFSLLQQLCLLTTKGILSAYLLAGSPSISSRTPFSNSFEAVYLAVTGFRFIASSLFPPKKLLLCAFLHLRISSRRKINKFTQRLTTWQVQSLILVIRARNFLVTGTLVIKIELYRKFSSHCFFNKKWNIVVYKKWHVKRQKFTNIA